MEIGTNASQIIRNNLERIDRINYNKYLSNKSKKIAERKTSNKIINQVTDLHWKSINELTKHNNIMIGNWSTILKKLCFFKIVCDISFANIVPKIVLAIKTVSYSE